MQTKVPAGTSGTVPVPTAVPYRYCTESLAFLESCLRSWRLICESSRGKLARGIPVGHGLPFLAEIYAAAPEFPSFFRVSLERTVLSPIFTGQPRQSSPSVGLGYREPLAGGERGTAQTIKRMRQLVDQALSDSTFIRQAKDILRSVPAHDEWGEIEAIYNWVLRNIRFTKDPVTKETLYPPVELLKIRSGDCDDMSMLLGALYLAAGYPARLVTIAANPEAPQEFSHVYAEVEMPAGSGHWIPVDAARPGAQFGIAPAMYYRKRVWSLIDDEYQDLNGMTRLRGLGSYARVRGLGDIDWGAILTQTIQETPQIIAVASGQPTNLTNKAGVVATGPYSSFASPYTPGYGIPTAGYPTAGVSAYSSSGWILPVLALGALVLLLKR